MPNSESAKPSLAPIPKPWVHHTTVILWLIMVYHVVVTPFTKVEESFYMQAVHDIVNYGFDVDRYDHIEFPGVVPRSFIGPLIVALPLYIIQYAVHLVWRLVDFFPMGSWLSILPRAWAVFAVLTHNFGWIGVNALLTRPPEPVPLSDLVPFSVPFASSIYNTYSTTLGTLLAPVTASPSTLLFSNFLSSSLGEESPYSSDSATYVLNSLLSRSDQLWLQVMTRLIMGTITVLTLSAFCLAAQRRFSTLRGVGTFLALTMGLMFHLGFYSSRLLANVFALQFTAIALTAWLNGHLGTFGITAFTFAAFVLRCDIVVLAGPIFGVAIFRSLLHLCNRDSTSTVSDNPTLYDQVNAHNTLKEQSFIGIAEPLPALKLDSEASAQRRYPGLSFGSIPVGIQVGIASCMVSLALTVKVDSYFWKQRLMWPELRVLLFNTVENRSAEWGVMPWHWYFTSALPRALGPALLLIPLSVFSLSSLRYVFHILKHRFGFDRGLVRRAKNAREDLQKRIASQGLECTYSTPACPKLKHWIDIDMLTLTAPAILFVSLYSILPHKEVRFILPSYPLFALILVLTLSKLSSAGGEYARVHRSGESKSNDKNKHSEDKAERKDDKSMADKSKESKVGDKPHDAESKSEEAESSPSSIYVNEPSNLWRFVVALFCVFLAAVAFFGSTASMVNYPGGAAMITLNKAIEYDLLHNPSHVRKLIDARKAYPRQLFNTTGISVHLCNLACISGVTRFGELRAFPGLADAMRTSGPGYAPVSPREAMMGTALIPFRVEYSKEEGLTHADLQQKGFDWLISEQSEVPGYIAIGKPIESFAGWKIDLQSEGVDESSATDLLLKEKIQKILSNVLQWPPKFPKISISKSPSLYIQRKKVDSSHELKGDSP